MLQRINTKFFLLLVPSVIGVVVILYSTRWGAGLSQDSLFYIGGAHSILRLQGFSYMQLGEVRAINNFPPLFSLVLVPLGLAGMDLFEASRWVNALLFGINILFVGYLVYRKTSAFWPSALAAFLMLTSADMIAFHSLAHSEPLYISLGLCTIYLLDKYILKSETSALMLAALSACLASLTRYVGVTLIVTICISVLILSKRNRRQRLLDCVIAGVISCAPLLLWFARNRAVSRNELPLASGAELAKVKLAFHPIQTRHLKVGVDTLSRWLLPPSVSSSLRALVLVSVLLILVLGIVWLGRNAASTLLFLNLTYVLVYFLGLAFLISFISIDADPGPRYLLPPFVSIVLTVIILLYRACIKARRPFGLVITGLCVLFLVSYSERAVSVVNVIHQYGMGWEGPMWKQSKIIGSIENLSDDVRIYSNLPISIEFLTHREIYALPYRVNPHTEFPNPDYLQRLKEIRTTAGNHRTLVMYVNFDLRCFPSKSELEQALALREVQSGPEGSLYEVLN